MTEQRNHGSRAEKRRLRKLLAEERDRSAKLSLAIENHLSGRLSREGLEAIWKSAMGVPA